MVALQVALHRRAAWGPGCLWRLCRAAPGNRAGLAVPKPLLREPRHQLLFTSSGSTVAVRLCAESRYCELLVEGSRASTAVL